MIEVCEGLGGWTIKVRANGHMRSLECVQYAYKDKHGITWFDFHRAMRDAEKLYKVLLKQRPKRMRR